MIPDSSAALRAFSEELDRQRSDHTRLRYDLTSLSVMEETLRAAAMALVLELAGADDVRAVESLGALPSEMAFPVLEDRREHGGTWTRAAATRWLAALRGSDDDLARLRAAFSGWDLPQQALAAHALQASKNPGAVDALLDRLLDPTPAVRVRAQEALVERLGLEALNTPRQAPLRTMQLSAMGSAATIWPDASASLHDVFRALLAGASPESLGLVYQASTPPDRADALWELIIDRSRSIPLETLDTLSPHDRAWLRAVFLARLSSADPRGPDVLVRLGTPQLREHLEEAVRSSQPSDQAFREACWRVLGTMPPA